MASRIARSMDKDNPVSRNGATERYGLARMFMEGGKAIGIQKTEDLFKQLESRDLTDEEMNIIESRVALQRKMLQEYEKREQTRKVREIQDICPHATEEEILKALELCDHREEEAALQLANATFLRHVRVSLGIPQPAQGAPQTRAWAAKPGSARPKRVDPSKCSGEVFFGSFRGRGFPAGGVAQAAVPPLPAQPPAAGAEPQSGAKIEAPSQTPAAEPSDSEATVSVAGQDVSLPGKRKRQQPQSPSPAPSLSKPQMYGLMRELSDGTLRPATTSEVGRAHMNTRSRSATPQSVTHQGSKQPAKAKKAPEKCTLVSIAEDENVHDSGSHPSCAPAAEVTRAGQASNGRQTLIGNASHEAEELDLNGEHDISKTRPGRLEILGSKESSGMIASFKGDLAEKRAVTRTLRSKQSNVPKKEGASDVSSWSTDAVTDEDTETDDDFMSSRDRKDGKAAKTTRGTKLAGSKKVLAANGKASTEKVSCRTRGSGAAVRGAGPQRNAVASPPDDGGSIGEADAAVKADRKSVV